MSGLDIDRFIDGLHEYIGRALKPLSDRLKAVEDARAPSPELEALSARVATLEAVLLQTIDELPAKAGD